MTLAVFLVGVAPASASTTRFVNAATGSDSGSCGSQAAPCLTISQAVTNASAGDTIQIAAGTYDEAVATAGKDLNFVGAGMSGSGRTLIDGSGSGQPALKMTDGGQVSELAITTTDDGSEAFLVETAGTVDASHIAVTGAASDTASNAQGSPHGSDAVSVGNGSTLNLSDSSATAVNTDADIQDDSNCTFVVADGSAVEAAGGTTNVTASTLSAVRGIALRNRQPSGNTTLATTVSDSVIESSGAEDLATGCDGWQAIEAASPTPLTLTGDTVYNATTAPVANGQPPADAITVEPEAGVSVVAHNTIFRAAAAGTGGFDVDANDGPLTADHSAYTTTNAVSGGTITAPATSGNLAGDPGFVDPSTGNFALAAGSPLIGSGDPSVVESGETDLTGAPRASTCTGGLSVVNIGALESAAPACPLAAPSPQPGPHSYGYVARTGGGTSAFAYEQFSVGAGGVLSQLSPFEAPSVSASGPGGLLAGAASAQVYAVENGALQQYQVGSSGQLTPGATLGPPTGQTLGSAALTPDGHDLYVSFGAGSTETLVHYTVGAGGALTAGGSTTLPAGTQGAGLAVDQHGRLYVLTGDGGGNSTLRDYRVNSDGTISQIDSLEIATGGALAVAANGSEAAIMVRNTDSSGSGSNGTIWPVAISATGVLSEPSTTNVPASGASGGTSNIPTGATFSADGKTLYVTDEDEFGSGGSLELYGSLVARFAVGAGGGLTAANSNPQATQGLFYDGGSALGPDATSLYIPDDHAFSGTVDQFNIAPDTSLAPKSPPSVDSDDDQGAMVLVAPPAPTTTTTTSRTTSTATTTSTRGGSGPPPPPAPPGITGQVSFAAGGRGVSGATVTACRSNSSDCVTALSDRGGNYRLAVGSGTWLVTVNPPTTTVLPASAYVEVSGNDRATRNFALVAAVGLDHGVVFNTPNGPVDGGEPTVYWNQPFSFSVPAGAPGHHAANTTLLVSHFIGMGQNPSRAEAGLELAGVVLYGVHYGADGKPEGMTAPLVGTISCNADCAQLTDAGAGPPFGSPGLVVAPASDGASRIYTEAPNGNPVTLTVKGYTSSELVRGSDPLARTAVDIGPHPPGGAGGLAAMVKDEMDQLTTDPTENGPDAANIDNGNDYVQADAESVGATTHGAEQWYDEGTDGVAGPQPPKGSAAGVSSYYPDTPKGYSAQDLADAAAAEQSAVPADTASADADAQEQAAIDDYLDDAASSYDQPPDEDLPNGPSSVAEAVQVMEQNIDKYSNSPDGVNAFLADAYEYVGSGTVTRAEADDAYQQLVGFAQAHLPAGFDDVSMGDDHYDDPGYYAPTDDSDGLVLSTSKYPDTAQGLSDLYNDAAAWAAQQQLDGTQRQALCATVDQFAKTYLPNATAAEQALEDDDATYYDGTDYLDPSGLVHTAHGIPLVGARVTLTRSATRHGRQVAVPSGSAIMSPGNRRNPSHSTVLGNFGWDTIPGYYRVSARHAGCRPASTTVFGVPPPRANLKLALRCRPIHRRATRIALAVTHGRAGTLTVRATVKAARGRAPRGGLLGVLTIRLKRQRAVGLGVDSRGRALIDVYARRRTWRLTARFAGNGRFAPSSLRAHGHQ